MAALLDCCMSFSFVMAALIDVSKLGRGGELIKFQLFVIVPFSFSGRDTSVIRKLND